MEEKRIRIVSGHFGSGKTEFAVNYALSLKKKYQNVGLADLDIVNPYFRSRERSSLLMSRGVRLVGSLRDTSAVDVPSVSPEINTLIEDERIQTVLDTGGDPGGVRLLARFASMISSRDYEMFLVINANRPDTRRCDQVLGMIEKIRAVSRLDFSGLINNTHLLKDTGIDDIIRGAELSRDVSLESGIRLVYHSVPEWLSDDLPDEFNRNFEGEIFPLKLFMRDDWMS